MTISAKIIADSISPIGKRLTTFELRYPRFIHAEETTHRVLESMNGDTIEIVEKIADGLMYDENLSRNASSSRAIPVERMIQDVIDDPAMPIHWGKNQPGMQAREEHNAVVFGLEPNSFKSKGQFEEKWHEVDPDLEDADVYAINVGRSPQEKWLMARDFMIRQAREFAIAGYHKQIVNRLLETWLHINVVVTATEWDNFFALRLHKDAQPEIHELARQMKEAMDASTPVVLQAGDWHLPYVEPEDFRRYHISDLKALSVARCASVSYKTVDGKLMTLERAQAIYDKLVKADVFHASPFEHQATPDTFNKAVYDQWGEHDGWDWRQRMFHGNFVGWIQNRKLMEQSL